jgi:hypothetical protein
MSRIDRLFRSFLDLDWDRWPHVVILVASFLASRIPFLNSGFGDDIDAWMMANSSYDLITEHVYSTSRSPGYPLPEYVDSLVIKHGWLATNTLTMILSLASVIVFAKILKRLEVPNKGLLVVTYAFLPILWINSTNTMDYMWALSFIVFAWFFALRHHWGVAGLMMGLAIASRITSAALILPLLYLLMTETGGRKVRNAVWFLAASVTVSALFFLPLLNVVLWYARHGVAYGKYDWSNASRLVQIQDMIVYSFGLVPAALAAILVLVSSRQLYQRLVAGDRCAVFLLSAVAVVAVMFAYHPTEGPYLIPAVPFGLVLLGKIARRHLLVILCAFLLLSSYVSFNVTRSALGFPAFSTSAGIVGRDLENRNDETAFVQGIIDADLSHAVVVADWHLAVLHYLNERASSGDPDSVFRWEEGGRGLWDRKRDIFYAEALALDDLQELQAQGYTVYYVAAMREWTSLRWGYDLNAYGGIYLEVQH